MLPQSCLVGEAPLCKDFCWRNSPAQISRWCWVSPTLPSQDTAPAGWLSRGRWPRLCWAQADPGQGDGLCLSRRHHSFMGHSWEGAARVGVRAGKQEQNPGQGKPFFRQVMDDCPGKCEWWAQGRKGCCGRNECAVKSLFLFNLRFLKSGRITRINSWACAFSFGFFWCSVCCCLNPAISPLAPLASCEFTILIVASKVIFMEDWHPLKQD